MVYYKKSNTWPVCYVVAIVSSGKALCIFSFSFSPQLRGELAVARLPLSQRVISTT